MEQRIIIIGGGPAGMIAGLLFARAGLPVTVLEKHADFLRDFRGDTVHPSTMEILDQLGLLGKFLERPHSRIDTAEAVIGGVTYEIGDLSHLNTPAPFITMMPQWDFLDFLNDEARCYDNFSIEMNSEVIGLVEEGGRVAGVQMADGRILMTHGGLVIAADGRRSIARTDPALPLKEIGAPMDIFWFPIPKLAEIEGGIRGIIDRGQMLVMIDRGDYWQCAYLIAKGSEAAVRAGGIAAFRDRMKALAPDLGDLSDVLTDMDQLKLLSVALERLETWSKPGLLVIGDAAHTMSPIGGIGINLAIQDAVAAANILAAPMLRGETLDPLLGKVQARRMFATRIIQAGQKAVQDNVIGRVLAGDGPTKAPAFVKLLNAVPVLRRIPGRIIGLGIRRERVESPSTPAR